MNKMSETRKEKLFNARKDLLIRWVECLDFNADDKDNEDTIEEIEIITQKIKEMLSRR